MTGRTYMGIPRERIPWAPRIDPGTCIGCGDCLEFCPNQVFALHEQEQLMIVANPENCVVLCDKCAGACKQEAISFPDVQATRQLLRQLLTEASVHKPRRA